MSAPVVFGWVLRRYTTTATLRETAKNEWAIRVHHRLILTATAEWSSGLESARGEKTTAVKFSCGGTDYATDPARVFVCTNDGFSAYLTQAPYVERVRVWQHFSRLEAVDLTATSGADQPGPWAMDQWEGGLEVDEYRREVWHKRDRDSVVRTQRVRLAGYKAQAGARVNPLSIQLGELPAVTSGDRVWVCTLDEITAAEPLGWVNRRQAWEHIGQRYIYTPYSETPDETEA